MNANTIPERATWLTPDVAFNPYHALTAHDRAKVARSMAVAEGLLAAYDATVAFARNYVAMPLVRLYLRNRLVEELSQLSDRSLSDIGMSRREIVATARRAYPLFERNEGKNSRPATDARTFASIAQKATPANDDSNRQAA